LPCDVGIRPGPRVVDLCCACGDFSAPLARLVAGGTLIAVDLSAEMLERARQAVARARLGNIHAGGGRDADGGERMRPPPPGRRDAGG